MVSKTMPQGTSYRIVAYVHGTKRGRRKRELHTIEIGYSALPQPIESLRMAIFNAVDAAMRPGWNPLMRVRQDLVRLDDQIMHWEPFNATNAVDAINLVGPGATSEATMVQNK